MTLPPEGEIFRVRVDRDGGTEDGLSRNGRIHVRGNLDGLPKAYGVKILEHKSGYVVAEVVNDVSPDEATNLRQWQRKQEEEERDPREKKRDLQRLTPNSVESEPRNPWRKSDSDEEKEDEDEKSDEKFLGSKNHLLNDK
ncbi:hypothetical protein [Haloplanus salinarum]|uniref:hypothetical protein n=1 Tax=Haloplanus salinarum TaxID=1912324 RepID=UPI00214C02F3|nr:hypothetical protein [Haloplanus salinarum]